MLLIVAVQLSCMILALLRLVDWAAVTVDTTNPGTPTKWLLVLYEEGGLLNYKIGLISLTIGVFAGATLLRRGRGGFVAAIMTCLAAAFAVSAYQAYIEATSGFYSNVTFGPVKLLMEVFIILVVCVLSGAGVIFCANRFARWVKGK